MPEAQTTKHFLSVRQETLLCMYLYDKKAKPCQVHCIMHRIAGQAGIMSKGHTLPIVNGHNLKRFNELFILK